MSVRRPESFPLSRLTRATWGHPLAAALPLVLLLGACTKHDGEGEAAVPAPHVQDGKLVAVPDNSQLRHYLVIGEARREALQATTDAPAVIEADPSKLANILPPLSGRIQSLAVHLGDVVTVGQPLFTLDSADLAHARADLKTANGALELAKKTLARTEDLHSHGIAAQKDLEQAQSDFIAAQSEQERAAQVFSALGLPLDAHESPRLLTVHAPIAGRIATLSATPGTFANDATAPLMSIVDIRTVWVAASVQEKDLADVRAGDEATAVAQSYPGETFHGKVAFIADQLEADTRTIKVRIALDNSDGRLKPGMFARASFKASAHDVVTVPTTALVQDEARTLIFVEVSPWKFEPRQVTAGARDADQTEILTGIKEGERVVVKNGVLLND